MHPPGPPSSPLPSYYILMVMMMVVVWCVPSRPPFVSPSLVLQTDGDDDGGCFVCTLPTPLRLPFPRTTDCRVCASKKNRVTGLSTKLNLHLKLHYSFCSSLPWILSCLVSSVSFLQCMVQENNIKFDLDGRVVN